MLNQEVIEAFKEAWYSFDEIKEIQESLRHFEETWICYSKEEAFEIVNNRVFSKYKTNV